MKLSVAIITYNEERILEKTLSAVTDIADEIVIVDSFSTDRTPEICAQFSKVKFLQRRFDGFGSQKNFALEQCAGEWILFIDADEIPDELLLKEIHKIANSEKSEFDVYNIELDNILLGKVLKHGGWGNTWRERFFRKESGKFTEDIVHEGFKTKYRIGRLHGKIHHYTYKNIHHHIEKTNSYTTMMAQKMFANGKRSGMAKMYFKPKFQFFKAYVLKMGFLDGMAGYYAAKTSQNYTFLKYAKLHELQLNNGLSADF